MEKNNGKRWMVECDDERWFFSSRAKAREFAKRENARPGNRDIRNHGGYQNVDGVARVVDRQTGIEA